MAELKIIDDTTMLESAVIFQRNIKLYAPTKRIKRSTSIAKVSGRGNSRFVTVRIKAPEARAFAYGSGIHSTKGPRKPYPIVPRRGTRNRKGKAALYFYWEKMGQTFVGQKVMHPGVAPTGYIDKAKKDSQKEIRKLMKDNAVKNIRTYLKVEFGKVSK